MSDSKKNTGSKQRGVKKTLYVDKEALEKVQDDAEIQDRSISYIINAILREHYDLGKKKTGRK